MPTFIANIDEFDAAYAKVIEDDYESSLEFPDQFDAYESHLFSMEAAEMIKESKNKLSESLFRFFSIIFWDWMGDYGIQVNESKLDSEESMVNSAIPSDRVKILYDEIKNENVEVIAKTVFSKMNTAVFSTPTELEEYLSVWWKLFQEANTEGKGIVVQAD